MSSPSPLVSALADDAAKQRLADAKRYAQLLAASMPVPGDPPETAAPDPRRVTQLKVLAVALNKSPADVEADAAVIRQLRHHRNMIARARGNPAARRLAMAAFTDYDAESVRIIADRRRGYFKLYSVYEHLGLTRRAASDSVADLNRLLDKNPELLRHEERASVREFE